MRKISAICDELYLTIIPEVQHDDEAIRDMTVIDKFIAIQEKLMVIIRKFITNISILTYFTSHLSSIFKTLKIAYILLNC